MELLLSSTVPLWLLSITPLCKILWNSVETALSVCFASVCSAFLYYKL